ncbi:hypothetical protein DIZ76_015709 [Coccidioides immitis]|nr:hypothetical protein DIZ76_015709 [Coccidioides immitis]
MDRIKISDIEALIYSTIQPWIKCIRELSTFHEILQAYSLYYGAGKALNNSNKDVHAIVQGLKPQEHMMYTVCQMLQSINSHHSLELISTQLSSVNQLPEI